MRHVIFVVFQFITTSFLAVASTSAEPSSAAHELAQKFATEGQEKSEPVAATVQKDYEKELLEAARTEAQTRRRAHQQRPAPKYVDMLSTPPKAAPRAPPKPSTSHSAPAAKTVDATPGQRMQIKIEAKIAKPAPAQPPVDPSTSNGAGSGEATVLIVLTDHTGQRRAASDPIICVGDICYLSSGLEKAAKPVAKTDALSTRNAITHGAAACKGRQRCAFRNVMLKPGSDLRIVDLGIVRHDRHESVEAKVDRTCAVDQGDLVCDDPRTAPDYRIWLVPEAVAAAAGTEAIEAALASDLPEENIARATDK